MTATLIKYTLLSELSHVGNKKIVRKEATYAAEEKGMFRLLRLTDRMPLRHDYSVFK